LRAEILKTLWPYSWWPIICGVNWGSQRALVFGLVTVACLGLTSAGCQAQSSIQAAQTAIVVGQTALATVQPVVVTLQGALAGAKLEVTTRPDGAPPQEVTDVDIQATEGNLGELDPQARRAAASAALVAASRYFPNATITLNVLDGGGTTLLSGTVAPGQQPSVQ
jgi:hypothetical protein